MPLPTPYVFEKNVQITADLQIWRAAVGVRSVTNGSPNVTWISGAVFNTAALPFNPNYGRAVPQAPMWNGATINIGGVNYVISNALGSGVTSQTTLVLAANYAGVTNANIAYCGFEHHPRGVQGRGVVVLTLLSEECWIWPKKKRKRFTRFGCR